MSIRPKKSLGQNFLQDPHYLGMIVDAAAISPSDQVLEIGPGMGHLTRHLASRAGRVLALELDERLVPVLQQEFKPDPKVAIVQADALEYCFETLPGTWKVVANLPYYISTPLIQKLLAARARFSSLTLMLQKEVAERIAAQPGGKEYGYLSVMVQLATVPQFRFLVPPGAFRPVPGVDSAVVTLEVRAAPAVALRDEAFFVRLVKAAFSQRRKTLRNSLKQLDIAPDITARTRELTGIDLGRRAETLSVEEFGSLADHLGS